MKKEKQIGIRVGLPAFFALEVEDVYKHASGAHRALAFPDFLGFLIGLGLEAYRKQYRQGENEKAPDTPPDYDRITVEPTKADFWDFPNGVPVRPRDMRRELEEAVPPEELSGAYDEPPRTFRELAFREGIR